MWSPCTSVVLSSFLVYKCMLVLVSGLVIFRVSSKLPARRYTACNVTLATRMASRQTQGSLHEFQPDSEEFSAYMERVEIFFAANYVKATKKVDQYPLPKPSDLMTYLTGGCHFSKLDLTSAYQLMCLDDESAQLVAINTHQGLYEYTRLPFGVASTPAVFQHAMDTVLCGIPMIICYFDHILITGRTDEEHLCPLEQVLKQLHMHGIRLEREKCHFFQPSVEYLGHIIDKRGCTLHQPRSRPFCRHLPHKTSRNFGPF